MQANCEYIKFPERVTVIGKIINEYLTGKANLNDQAIHLLFSANRWELKYMMGNWNVLDRYAESGVAYSAAKGLDLAWCKAPDHGLPKPDILIFIDVPVESSANRNGYGTERYEKIEFQLKVRSIFDALKDDTWIFVDGAGSIHKVGERVKKAIVHKVETVHQNPGPLKTLNWK